MSRVRSFVVRSMLPVLVAGGCSAPRSLPVAERRSPDQQAAEEERRRDRRERYLERVGLRLTSAAVPSLAPLGTRVRLEFTIHNDGSAPVELPMRRRRGWWPFGTVETGRALVEVEAVEVGAGSGVHRVVDSLDWPDLEDLTVPPGGQEVLTREIDLPAEVDYAEIDLRANLFPLAVQAGNQPECFLALPFPALRVRGIPATLPELGETPEAALEAGFADPSRGLLAAAILWGEQEPIRAVDRLLGPLPESHPEMPAHVTAALRWITGEELGGSLERWRGWWASSSGAAWAQRQRLRGKP